LVTYFQLSAKFFPFSVLYLHSCRQRFDKAEFMPYDFAVLFFSSVRYMGGYYVRNCWL
jgi:hypothetical protein